MRKGQASHSTEGCLTLLQSHGQADLQSFLAETVTLMASSSAVP